MTDIVDRLRRWTHDPQVPPASDLMDEAADEIVRLRGELVLWKAAAKLTTAEQVSLAVAIDHLGGLHCGNTAKLARELRFILERLTFPVPEPVPKEKRAEVCGGSYQKTDENRGNCDTCRAEVDRLRDAIRRLADQDATLSVQNGNVTVTMDATLTPEEREAVKRAANFSEGAAGYCKDQANVKAAMDHAATLRGLLERLA